MQHRIESSDEVTRWLLAAHILGPGSANYANLIGDKLYRSTLSRWLCRYQFLAFYTNTQVGIVTETGSGRDQSAHNNIFF